MNKFVAQHWKAFTALILALWATSFIIHNPLIAQLLMIAGIGVLIVTYRAGIWCSWFPPKKPRQYRILYAPQRMYSKPYIIQQSGRFGWRAIGFRFQSQGPHHICYRRFGSVAEAELYIHETFNPTVPVVVKDVII